MDTREQRPLLFPTYLDFYPDRRRSSLTRIALTTRKSHLPEGDYVLDGFPPYSGIERKYNLSELSNNLFTTDYKRFTSALDRLADTFKYPYLFVEGSLMDLHRASKYHERPELIHDALNAALTRRDIRLLLVGRCSSVKARTLAGAYITRTMLNHALCEQSRIPKIKPSNPLTPVTNPVTWC